jgi:hypothetical protein
LLDELERLVQAGKVGKIGLYGEPEVIEAALANGPSILRVMQCSANPFNPVVAKLASRTWNDRLLIGNHPFGNPGRVKQIRFMIEAMASDLSIDSVLREKLVASDWNCILEVMFGIFVFGTSIGALVFSMMQKSHLQMNVEAVEHCRFDERELAFLRDRIFASSRGADHATQAPQAGKVAMLHLADEQERERQQVNLPSLD